MLDRKFIIDNADAVRKNCAARGARVELDRLLALENDRRAKQAEVEQLNQRANEVAKSIGATKDAAQREARKDEGRRLREAKESAQRDLDAIVAQQDAVRATIPNMTHPDAPVGSDEASNREVGRGRTGIPKFDFTPRDHVARGETLGLMDLEGGAKIAGHGFYFLKNDAVLLELALQRFAIDVLIREGFTPTITPDLARGEILQGIGFLPRGPEAQVYAIEGTDLNLVATAEITLGGLMADMVLEADQLPIKICGVSHCFRKEADAHGRDTRGIYRVHQFTKVEMFAFTLPEQSDAMHEYIRELECRIFDELGIPYRVIDTATGDLGGPAYRKYDLEAWMPGRDEKGAWGEVTSTSNCTDYQARRLAIRYRAKGEKGTQFVHTLNGTAIAVTRAIIAIVENHQRADGSVDAPLPLRPWMGKDRIVPLGSVPSP